MISRANSTPQLPKRMADRRRGRSASSGFLRQTVRSIFLSMRIQTPFVVAVGSLDGAV